MDIGRVFFNNSFLEGSVCRETSESEVIFVPDSVYCWSGTAPINTLYLSLVSCVGQPPNSICKPLLLWEFLSIHKSI